MNLQTSQFSVLAKLILAVAAILSLVTIGKGQSCLASGCLDDTFGTLGRVTENINNSSASWANDVAIQLDGKIVVAVRAANYPAGTGSDFYVLRYNPDGSIDQMFGSNGVARISFTSTYDDETADALAIQTDGKIVVAGSAPLKAGSSTSGFAITRLNMDGGIDTSFGTNGKVLFNFLGKDNAFAKDVVLQSNGYIVAVGDSSNNLFAVARVTTTGVLDSGFNGSGKITVQTATGTDFGGGYGVAIQLDGKIVAAGFRPSVKRVGRDFAVLRINVDGTLDSSFGSGGKVFTDFIGLNDEAGDVAIDDTGKIVVVGRAKMGSSLGTSDLNNYRFGIVRYLSNGQLDPSFGSGGKVSAGVTGYYNDLNDVAIQLDGKIVAAGNVHISGTATGHFGIARFDAVNGSLDTSFGPDMTGIVLTDFSAEEDDCNALALQWDGKIVAVGLASGAHYIALARYLP